MATNKTVKAIPASKYPLGNAKENKDAKVYAKNGTSVADAKASVTKPGNPMDTFNIAVGGTNKGNYAAENKHGEKTMRGYGAATKGIKTRGPMA
jgi:hypothetical protein